MKKPWLDSASMPPCPQAWYLVARSAQVKAGCIVARQIGSTEIIVYRGTQSGDVFALAAHCPHMGCHFKHGTVVGDKIQCALHHRLFNARGKCVSSSLDGTRRGRHFACQEFFGAVFVFLGDKPAYPFPGASILDGQAVRSSLTKDYPFAVSWQALIANGCDIDHLRAVHGRGVKEKPRLAIHADHFSIEYQSYVTGKRLSDRVIKRLSANCIRVKITVFSGTLMKVESRVGKRSACLLLSMVPTFQGTVVRGVVAIPRSPTIFNMAAVRMSRWLFEAFLRKDFRILDGLEFRAPDQATLGDEYTRRILAHFDRLSLENERTNFLRQKSVSKTPLWPLTRYEDSDPRESREQQ